MGREEAVRNPLAQTIAEAVRSKGWSSVFEPVRTHPGDWANPGRVRVKMRDEDGRWIARGVKNSMSFFFPFVFIYSSWFFGLGGFWWVLVEHIGTDEVYRASFVSCGL